MMPEPSLAPKALYLLVIDRLGFYVYVVIRGPQPASRMVRRRSGTRAATWRPDRAGWPRPARNVGGGKHGVPKSVRGEGTDPDDVQPDHGWLDGAVRRATLT